MTKIILISLLLTLFGCEKLQKNQPNSIKPKLEILLIGTFHFRNFDPNLNLDIAKTKDIDVLSAANQNELEKIALKISKFNPTKIYVEYAFDDQNKLDSLYNSFAPTDYKKVERNEIQQIAFRVGKNLRLNKIYGCNYWNFKFNYDQMMQSIAHAKQKNLLEYENKSITEFENEYNEITIKRNSLLDALYFLNNDVNRKKDLSWYSNFANKAGSIHDTTGVFLAAEWYRRNLFMYANIQKQIKEKDKRILILLGASHVAILKSFIELDASCKIIELIDIMQ